MIFPELSDERRACLAARRAEVPGATAFYDAIASSDQSQIDSAQRDLRAWRDDRFATRHAQAYASADALAAACAQT